MTEAEVKRELTAILKDEKTKISRRILLKEAAIAYERKILVFAYALSRVRTSYEPRAEKGRPILLSF